jgi:hypothetical protein
MGSVLVSADMASMPLLLLLLLLAAAGSEVPSAAAGAAAGSATAAGAAAAAAASEVLLVPAVGASCKRISAQHPNLPLHSSTDICRLQ